MRIIWYVLDGLTPCMIQSFSDKKNDNVKDLAPLNYIDNFAKDSFIVKTCYGYGETMASLSAMVTGMDVKSLKSDMPSHPDSYHGWPTIADYFKKIGFSTIFYRNFPPDGLRREGPYKRYNALESQGFDRVCLEDEVVPLRESKFIQQQEDFFLLKSDKPVFIFIHDLCLHDHPLVQRNGTKEGLSKAIVECSEQMRDNLQYINYKEADDVLIFSSDHGMTMGPYDDLFFDKNISENTIEHYWPKLTADFKLRTCFFIKGPGIEPGNAAGIFEIRDMFVTVLDFLKIKHTPIDAISAKSHTRKSALVSVFGSTFEYSNWKKLDHWFHPYIIYIENSKKWIYRKSKKAKCYYIDLRLDPDEDKPILISFSDFPLELKKYIKEYFSIGRNLYRLFYVYHPKIIINYFAEKCLLKLKQPYNLATKSIDGENSNL